MINAQTCRDHHDLHVGHQVMAGHFDPHQYHHHHPHRDHQSTMLTMLAGGSQDEQLHNQRTLAKQRLQRDALSQEEQAHYPGTLCDAIENSADFR